MASSEILFKGRVINIKDSILGRFIDELLLCTSDGWLYSVSLIWKDDWLSMPPGCKDIELDSVLKDDDHCNFFIKKIEDIKVYVEPNIQSELDKIICFLNNGRRLSS